MKAENIILTSLFVLIAVTIGFMSYFHAFESGLIVNTIAWIFAWISFYVALRISYTRELLNAKDKAQEENLDYCWTMANQQLSRMPGGLQLLWERGDGGNVSARVYVDHKNQPNFFYAFVAYVQDTKTQKVVYYNATRKNVWYTWQMPEGRVWNDLFAGFKPFDKQSGGVPVGYNNKGNRVRVDIGGSDAQPMANYPMPSPQYVDDSFSNMNGGNDD